MRARKRAPLSSPAAKRSHVKSELRSTRRRRRAASSSPAERGRASSARSRRRAGAADCGAAFSRSQLLAAVDALQIASVSPPAGRRTRCAPPVMPTMRSAKRRASSTSCMLTITGMPRSPASSRQQLHDLDRGLRIERRGRLVGEQDVGLLHDRARDADALPLAAGQRIGALRSRSRQGRRRRAARTPRRYRRRELAPPRPPRRHVARAAAEQVLHHGQALDQVVLLEHHADAPPRLAQRRAGQLGEIVRRRSRISPAVGSTSRLMQRISVDLPVPDGPMIAVMPRAGDVEIDVAAAPACRGRYSLRSFG